MSGNAWQRAVEMDDREVGGTTNPLTLSRLWAILRREWWVIALCLVLAGVGALGYTRTRPASYAATAVVAIAVPNTSGASSSGAPSPPPGPNPVTEVYSSAVVDAAATAAHLQPTEVQLTATPDASYSNVGVTATEPSARQAVLAANAAAASFATQRVGEIRAEVSPLAPQLLSLENQIKSLEHQIAAQGATRPSAGSQTGAAVGLPQSELTVLTNEYQGLYAQQVTLDLAAQSVHFLGDASVPGAPISQDKKKLLEIALAAGLFLGCGIALIREQVDDRIHSAADLAETGSCEFLAELPTSRALRRGGTIATTAADELAESMRQLRTAIRFAATGRELQTVLVASPVAGEGKSFVAANLAVAWAMSGEQTVLVSSDLRRPSLERLFGIGPGFRPGLVDAIAVSATGDAPRPGVDELLVATGVDGLSFLPSGTVPANPTELLGSPAMAAFVDALRARAGIVVLDSPPVLAVADARLLSAYADGVLLVLAEGRSSRAGSRRAIRLLTGGPVPLLGVVLNRSSRPYAVRYPYYEQDKRARRSAHLRGSASVSR